MTQLEITKLWISLPLLKQKFFLHLRGEQGEGEDELKIAEEEDASDVKKIHLHTDTLQVKTQT